MLFLNSLTTYSIIMTNKMVDISDVKAVEREDNDEQRVDDDVEAASW